MIQSLIKSFLLISHLLVLVSCATGPSPKSFKSKHVVVFVPGFYGSKIVDQKNNTIWMSTSQALFGSDTLAFEVPGVPIPGVQKFKGGPILDKVPFLGVFGKDIYGESLENLQTSLGSSYSVVPFSYDWRQENSQSAKELFNFVAQIKKQGPRSISIVAHSMGGLVTSYFLRYGGSDMSAPIERWQGLQLVDRVVIAGTPFKGAMIVFRNMNFGVKFGFNTDLMKAESFSSIHSTYEMLPRYKGEGKLGEEIKDIKNWTKYSWGLVKGKNKQQRIEYLKRRLKRSQSFYRLIHSRPKSKPPKKIPVLNFYSSAFDTLGSGYYSKKGFKWVYQPGDQTVPAKSARLPKLFYEMSSSLNEIKSPVEHQDFFKDEANLGEIKNRLMF